MVYRKKYSEQEQEKAIRILTFKTVTARGEAMNITV